MVSTGAVSGCERKEGGDCNEPPPPRVKLCVSQACLPRRPIIASCGTGVTASVLALALHSIGALPCRRCCCIRPILHVFRCCRNFCFPRRPWSCAMLLMRTL